MAKKTVNVDEAVWNEAKGILAELGIGTSAAIEMYLRRIIRDRGIPFDVTLGPAVAEEGEEQR